MRVGWVACCAPLRHCEEWCRNPFFFPTPQWWNQLEAVATPLPTASHNASMCFFFTVQAVTCMPNGLQLHPDALTALQGLSVWLALSLSACLLPHMWPGLGQAWDFYCFTHHHTKLVNKVIDWELRNGPHLPCTRRTLPFLLSPNGQSCTIEQAHRIPDLHIPGIQKGDPHLEGHSPGHSDWSNIFLTFPEVADVFKAGSGTAH